MSLNASTLPSNSNFVRRFLEAGAYPARLVGLMTFGKQPQRPYKGVEKPPALTMRTTYEMLDEFLVDEEGNELLRKPLWQSEEWPFYSLSIDQAKSTERYKSLDPENKYGGNWPELLGMPCMITLSKEPSKKPGNTNIYNNITGVSAMTPKQAAKADQLINPTFMFDFYEPDMEVYAKQPDWVKEKFALAVDYKGGKLESLVNNLPEDEKPAETKVLTGAEDNKKDW